MLSRNYYRVVLHPHIINTKPYYIGRRRRQRRLESFLSGRGIGMTCAHKAGGDNGGTIVVALVVMFLRG